MGRTIPSFRLASVEEEREWKVFRNALDKSDGKIFDEIFSIPRSLIKEAKETLKLANRELKKK
jgi:hypothetical protein